MADPIITPCGLSPLSGPWDDGVTGEQAKRRTVLAVAVDNISGEVLSLLQSCHPIDANIAMQFQAQLNAGVALDQTGHLLFTIKKADDQAQRRIEQEVRRCMEPFVKAGYARIESLLPKVEGDTGSFDLKYKNLFTGGSPTITVQALG
jgi:hypothetical protein